MQENLLIFFMSLKIFKIPQFLLKVFEISRIYFVVRDTKINWTNFCVFDSEIWGNIWLCILRISILHKQIPWIHWRLFICRNLFRISNWQNKLHQAAVVRWNHYIFEQCLRTYGRIFLWSIDTRWKYFPKCSENQNDLNHQKNTIYLASTTWDQGRIQTSWPQYYTGNLQYPNLWFCMNQNTVTPRSPGHDFGILILLKAYS